MIITNLHAMGLMNTRDFDNYQHTFELVSSFLQPPDLLIYLRADVPTLIRNIQTRGRCGHEMAHSTTERALQCPECKNLLYPKICPVAIVAVRNGDKLLLTKYKGRGDVPFYALVAGFAEIGEPIEDTVRREVMEETGVKVTNLKFYKSQPWALSDSLLMGFFCDADGDQEPHADENELSVAEWVAREDIPNRYDDFALTAEMIEYFRVNGKGEY